MKIHERIRAARQTKGWTQEEMADKLGMSVNGYGNLERADCDLKLSRLIEISRLLGIELADLFAKPALPDLAAETPSVYNPWCSGAVKADCPYLKVELEKQQLFYQLQFKEKELELKNIQIQYLAELNQLLKND